jgi:cation diffusion facilitator CzcD-associated flavoprotein CzcO
MSDETDVAIVGAGPYGLSLASHLAHRGVSFRIFGRPMENWLKMPRGMSLKSDGFASGLFDPGRALPLDKFCREQGYGYADLGLPVPVSTFCDYGLAFQKRLVPGVDRRLVAHLSGRPDGFGLRLEDGTALRANRVVLATGITNLAWMPPELRGLPPELVSHSAQHSEPTALAGKRVTVLGGGSSAIDLAAFLHEAGVDVQLVTRRATLPVHSMMRLPRRLADRLREPLTGLGPSWRSLFFVKAPGIVRLFPAQRRLRWVKQAFGPAAGWFMAERIRNVPTLYGQSPAGADVVDGRVRLHLESADGKRSTLETDHLIVATGYRVDIARLDYLAPALRQALATVDDAPVLTRHFESSVPHLYFIGPAAAATFGPLMRFAYGARYTAPRLAQRLAVTSARTPQRQPANDLGKSHAAAHAGL